MTWNIWFESRYARVRMSAISALVRVRRPDVVALQEVTGEHRYFLEGGDSVLADEYRRVETGVERREPYWEAIYTTLPIGPRSGRLEYAKSRMGRGCTVLFVEDLSLAVGSTHLESLDNPRARESQAGEAIGHLDALPVRNRILLGDMNLHDDQSLDHLMGWGWRDAWKIVHPEIAGHTHDTKVNRMIRGTHRERLDRIFLNCRDYRPVHMELLGTAPVVNAVPDVLPSDHFGLWLELAPSSRS